VEGRTRRIWTEQDRHPGDRLRLFCAIHDALRPRAALYPGSFADIAPSFVIDDVTYVDDDRRAARFFSDNEGVDELIATHRKTDSRARWRFIATDYRDRLPVDDASVDLLISLYAGLVSDSCTRYLRPGGLLLANTSHGDASIAALDDRYELAAAVLARAGGYRIVTDGLGRFLQPRASEDATAERIRAAGRGVAYTTPAFAYVFRLLAG
jgi:hypothetical protein